MESKVSKDSLVKAVNNSNSKWRNTEETEKIAWSHEGPHWTGNWGPKEQHSRQKEEDGDRGHPTCHQVSEVTWRNTEIEHLHFCNILSWKNNLTDIPATKIVGAVIFYSIFSKEINYHDQIQLL